jgi:HSP20 family protein
MNNLVSKLNNGRRFGTLLDWDPMRLFSDDLSSMPSGAQVLWSAINQSAIHVTHGEDITTLTVDMPGVDPHDLDLTFENGTLSIAGKRGERTSHYTVALGDTIDPNAIEAQLDKGVLTVRAHKRPEAKPKKIVVSTAKGLSSGESK